MLATVLGICIFTCIIMYMHIDMAINEQLGIYIPFGKHHHNYHESQFLMGKSTISMAIFTSKLLVITRG